MMKRPFWVTKLRGKMGKHEFGFYRRSKGGIVVDY